MAITIPESISALQNITNGEKRLFKVLKDILPENYMVWYELRVNSRYPDFIILGPDLGLVVLEVKDWQISSISEADSNTYTLHQNENHKNPIKQAREYMFHIVNELKKDRKLTESNGKYQGNLRFSYGHGVVFTRILKSSFEKSPFVGTIEEKAVIFQDEFKQIEENQDTNRLIEKLRAMIPNGFNFQTLEKNTIDRIRGNLFKEVKLSTDNEAIFKVMNLNQERYAKGLGYGHRVIRGVAGSGKTVVLMCRAKYLSELHKDWNILVLCFNKTLAAYLKDSIIGENIKNVEVSHLHGWINPIFKNNGLNSVYKDEDLTKNISKITDTMLQKEKKYDAIIIDEGQDFEKEWLAFIVKCLRNPEHSHLLLASDGAQNLYNRKYTLKSIGIKASGRTVIMRENYRNTKEILDYAHNFLIESIDAEDKNIEDNNYIINPKASLREGNNVNLMDCSDFYDEAYRIVGEITKLNKNGIRFGDICILYPFKKYKDTNYLQIIEEVLSKENIPYFSMSKSSNTKSKFKMDYDSVKLSTIHSSKGLDFKKVFICGINDGILKYSSLEKAKKLLYVGMTRARNDLSITYSVNNDITRSMVKTYKEVVRPKATFSNRKEKYTFVEKEIFKPKKERKAINTERKPYNLGQDYVAATKDTQKDSYIQKDNHERKGASKVMSLIKNIFGI
ncbi:MAG: NERD domain-containing protein [Marinisporobacter sp.]|jgi:superfamily I DNA and RNA helicase|nr:NERD domain-containing protein [Marinisporobacter sp.]